MSGQGNKLKAQIESLENYINGLNSSTTMGSDAVAKAIVSEVTKTPDAFAQAKHPGDGSTNMWQKAAAGEGGCACTIS
jgi:hypothetical protein